MDADPINQFFPDGEGEEDLLYTTLGLGRDATLADINSAYRKAALRHHPDKHANASHETKAAESAIFQQVGYAYAVLKDEARRKRYDATGRTDDASIFEEGTAEGWEAYFEQVFERVTRSKLDEIKAAYQGSEQERTNLLAAYNEHAGSLPDILENIMCATPADETRLVDLINSAIASGELKTTEDWTSSSKDKKAAKTRAKKAAREGVEAEELAKFLGIWDEFYGTGKPTKPRARGSAKAKQRTEDAAGDEEDDAELAGLKALMLKRQSGQADLYDSLEAKYLKEDEAMKASRRSAAAGKKGPAGKGKGKAAKENAPPVELDDADFDRIQKEMLERTAAAAATKKKRPAGAAGESSAGPAGKKRRGKQ